MRRAKAESLKRSRFHKSSKSRSPTPSPSNPARVTCSSFFEGPMLGAPRAAHGRNGGPVHRRTKL